jgi:hypothetical protein
MHFSHFGIKTDLERKVEARLAFSQKRFLWISYHRFQAKLRDETFWREQVLFIPLSCTNNCTQHLMVFTATNLLTVHLLQSYNEYIFGHITTMGLNPGQPMWDLWWTKWHWGRFPSKYFGFPLIMIISQMLICHWLWGQQQNQPTNTISWPEYWISLLIVHLAELRIKKFSFSLWPQIEAT